MLFRKQKNPVKKSVKGRGDVHVLGCAGDVMQHGSAVNSLEFDLVTIGLVT